MPKSFTSKVAIMLSSNTTQKESWPLVKSPHGEEKQRFSVRRHLLLIYHFLFIKPAILTDTGKVFVSIWGWLLRSIILASLIPSGTFTEIPSPLAGKMQHPRHAKQAQCSKYHTGDHTLHHNV